MSSIGQSIRNRYPLWSKIRRDDSSIGALIFNEIGRALEDERMNILSTRYQTSILSGKPCYEPGFLYTFSLEEETSFNNFLDDNRTYESLEATAEKDGEEFLLENLFSYGELARSLPTRVNVINVSSEEDYLVKLLEKTTGNNYLYRYTEEEFFFIDNPKRIYINVYDSENYEIKTYNRSMYEKKYITIRGTDLFGKRIEETILIPRDGIYFSKEMFRSIENLKEDRANFIAGGASIECYGFDGNVEISRYPVQIGLKRFPFKLLVKKTDDVNLGESLEENVAEIKISANPYAINQKSVLNYIFNVYALAENYLNERTDIEREFFEQVLIQQQILDSDLNELEVQDFCFDYVRNSLCLIDSNAKVHWYSLKVNAFERPEIERTKKSNIILESEKQQVVLGETLPIFASLERAKGNVSQVIIAKQKPSIRNKITDANNEVIEDFKFEYLQEDLTWSDNKYFFSGRDIDDVYLNFEGKTIEVLFDEYGQHDFYVISFASQFNKEESLTRFVNGEIEEAEFKKQLEGFLKDEFQETVLIDTYSVNCEFITPRVSFETNILGKLVALGENAEEYSLGIFFEGTENKLYVSATNEEKTYVFYIEEHKDYILFDYFTGSGAVVENYEKINLLINNSLEQEVVNNG